MPPSNDGEYRYKSDQDPPVLPKVFNKHFMAVEKAAFDRSWIFSAYSMNVKATATAEGSNPQSAPQATEEMELGSRSGGRPRLGPPCSLWSILSESNAVPYFNTNRAHGLLGTVAKKLA